MRLPDITVEVRTRSLQRLGQITPEDLHIAFTDAHNAVGEWSLRLPSDHHLADDLRQPGSGIVITGPGDTELYSGPTTHHEYAATPDDPRGVIIFEGVTDDVLLADALAWPEPANGNAETQGRARDVRTGQAEALMHAFVAANIGPSAPASRREALAAKLVMGDNANRGPTMTKAARFAVLGNVLADITAAAGGLGFRIIQRGTTLAFETFAVRDRSALVRLDVDHNTLAGHRVTIGTPDITRAIVGGDGQATAREFVAVTTAEARAAETAWGRRWEKFIDQRSTKDTSELEQAGLEALEDGGRTALAVQAVPMEDAGDERPMRFGPDWRLGDKVAVVVEAQELTAIVTGYTIRADSDGFRVGALLGDPTGYSVRAALAKRIKSLDTRLASLEHSAEPTDLAPIATRLTTIDARLTTIEAAPSVTALALDAHGSTDAAGVYPIGVSLMSTGSASGWPATSGHLVTTRSASAAEQRYSTAATGRTWMRHWTGTAWGTWDELVRASTLPRIASGATTVSPSTATGDYFRGSVAVAFPPGRFTSTPHVVVSASSIVPGIVIAATVDDTTVNGCVIYLARTNDTETGVRWIATQV